MEKEELAGLATTLHKRFGKKFHSVAEALQLIEPIWLQDPSISTAVLFSLATSGSGKKKSHVSEKLDSEALAEVPHPRSRHSFRTTRVR